jgi:hypothetical protein
MGRASRWRGRATVRGFGRARIRLAALHSVHAGAEMKPCRTADRGVSRQRGQGKTLRPRTPAARVHAELLTLAGRAPTGQGAKVERRSLVTGIKTVQVPPLRPLGAGVIGVDAPPTAGDQKETETEHGRATGRAPKGNLFLFHRDLLGLTFNSRRCAKERGSLLLGVTKGTPVQLVPKHVILRHVTSLLE